MIRHSSSFFISLIFHITILFLIFYSWKNIPIFHKKPDEKVCLKLSCLVEKKRVQNIKKRVIQKKVEPIIKKEIKKPVVKKVKLKKKKPLTVPIVKKEIPKKIEENQEIKQEVVKEKIEKKITEVITKEIAQKEDKEKRINRIQEEYVNENIQKIVKLLNENLYYPRSARKRGITGKVVIKFKLSTNSTVEFVEVIKSQSSILSRAAIKTIEDLSGKFPKPKEDLILEVPINYDLKNI